MAHQRPELSVPKPDTSDRARDSAANHGRIHHWGKWETFPTRILTFEIYWGISPVKKSIQARR